MLEFLRSVSGINAAKKVFRFSMNEKRPLLFVKDELNITKDICENSVSEDDHSNLDRSFNYQLNKFIIHILQLGLIYSYYQIFQSIITSESLIAKSFIFVTFLTVTIFTVGIYYRSLFIIYMCKTDQTPDIAGFNKYYSKSRRILWP